MLKAIIIDEREAFLSDITTRQLLDDERNVEIVDTLTSLEKLKTVLSNHPVDVIVVSDSIAKKQTNWNYGNCQVVGYALSSEGEQELTKKHIPSLGIVKQGGQLLDCLEKPLPVYQEKAVTETSPVTETEGKTVMEDNRAEPVQNIPMQESENPQTMPERQPYPSSMQGQPSGAYPEMNQGYPGYPLQGAGYPNWNPAQQPQAVRQQPYQQGASNNQSSYYPGYYPPQGPWQQQNAQPYPNYWYPPYGAYPNPQSQSATKESQNPPKAQTQAAVEQRGQQNHFGQAPYFNGMQPPTSLIQETQAPQQPPAHSEFPHPENGYWQNEAQKQFDYDFQRRQPKTTVVTVYAAKGGVGKTTVATETAVYLALTSNGRGHYRTCIVDYNIDFGDVEAVLFKDVNKGPNLYQWALDIKERMKAGEDSKKIVYSRKEIEQYLRVMKDVGLYVLCAPSTHQESMGVESVELEVILRNLKEYGGFDFVICDTGNNTRDSSIIALEAADYVLLVATQDFTTASCNSSVIEALNRFGLNLDKVRLVINNMMPVKYTGIPAKDVENYFSDYPCIARIRHDLDVVKANNFNTPIVLEANHKVTKEFRNIIAFLTTGQTYVPEKKSRFQLFRKDRK